MKGLRLRHITVGGFKNIVLIKNTSINQPLDIMFLSAGTKRLIWILTTLFINNGNGISFYGIKELETSIHPRLLKRMLEILYENLENTTLLISSYSPYLVQY